MTETSIPRPPRRGRRAVLACLAWVAWWAWSAPAGATDADPAAPPPLDGPMARFTPTDPPTPIAAFGWSRLDGTPERLADLAGRHVLLNLWATWCAPCVAELPTLARLAARLGGDRFAVRAVAIDRGGAYAVAPFLARQGLTELPVGVDPAGAAPRALGMRGLPTTVLIDPAGRELGRLAGDADWDGPEAVALIRHYLNRGGSAARPPGRPKPDPAADRWGDRRPADPGYTRRAPSGFGTP